MKLLKDLLRSTKPTASLLEAWFFSQNFLKSKGWFLSRYHRMPLDRNQQPIPWLTYSAIHFLEERLQKSMNLFEFGSGNSTLWFSERVASIISIEHDRSYYEFIKPKLQSSSNVEYLFGNLSSNYSEAIKDYSQKFDVVIVDGRNRVACAKNAISALTEEGVIIWDNSDRPRYQEGYDFLKSKGFKRIDFRGAGPISHGELQTAIFYRTNNCLGI